MSKIFLIIATLITAAAVILFPSHLRINVGSVLPLVMLIISAVQAHYFRRHRRRTDFNSSGGASSLSEEEWEMLSLYLSQAFAFSLPQYLPFIFFFPLWGKIMSIILYFVSFIGGNILFRFLHGRKVKERLRREAEELRHQSIREEMGRWK